MWIREHQWESREQHPSALIALQQHPPPLQDAFNSSRRVPAYPPAQGLFEAVLCNAPYGKTWKTNVPEAKSRSHFSVPQHQDEQPADQWTQASPQLLQEIAVSLVINAQMK